jgi:hypothetical protein
LGLSANSSLATSNPEELFGGLIAVSIYLEKILYGLLLQPERANSKMKRLFGYPPEQMW